MAEQNETKTTRTWGGSRTVQWTTFWADREEQVFLVLTLLIGALVGLTVVAFILVSERIGARLYPMGSEPWRRLLVPCVGSLLVGYVLYRFFPDARGSGVPQTKAALYVREGHITLWTVIGKFVCTSATLACGIPLGREGPAVQVGGGIASVLGRRLGMRPERVKALIPVGAAAAIAAAFNTPLAAVLFTLEEVVGDLHAPVLGSVVLASATSWGVLRLMLGNEPLFQVPQYSLVSSWELVVYAVLGVAGGILSVAFTQLLLRTRAWFAKLPKKTVWFQPLAGGLLIGVMGWFVPQAMGVGYKYVGSALNGTMGPKLMVALLLMKLVATAISYSSGNAGGIFGPSLFMGAMLGGAVGGTAQHFFPAFMAQPGAYALVGMGTAFAGVIRAPMTSVVMIFEITRNYAVIVPLMISNLVSYFVASRLQKKPVYEALADQDGIHLPQSENLQRRSEKQVGRLMRPMGKVLSTDDTLEDAVLRMKESDRRTWLVKDGELLSGLVNREDLEKAMGMSAVERRVRDLVPTTGFPHLHSDHTFDTALDRMGRAGLDVIPVVSRANVREVLGVVLLRDVLDGYGLVNESSVRDGEGI